MIRIDEMSVRLGNFYFTRWGSRRNMLCGCLIYHLLVSESIHSPRITASSSTFLLRRSGEHAVGNPLYLTQTIRVI